MRSRQSVSLTALRSRRQEAVASHHYMMGFRAVVIFSVLLEQEACWQIGQRIQGRARSAWQQARRNAAIGG